MLYRVWRGPAGVDFDPPFTEVKNGTGVTTAIFTVPGTYVLRARASDGRVNISGAATRGGNAKSTDVDVSVTVSEPAPTTDQ